MSKPNALVAHPNAVVAEELSAVLAGAGFEVGRCAAAAELEARAEEDVPKVALVALELLENGGLVDRWRDGQTTRTVPLVVVAGPGKEEHRRALRLRLTNVVQEPLEAEDVVLATLAAAGMDPPRGEPLRGSLETLPASDLLALVELHRRSGRVEFRGGEAEGFIEYEKGQIVDAALNDGRRDDDAVEALLMLGHGTFEARLSARGNGTRPERKASATPRAVEAPPAKPSSAPPSAAEPTQEKSSPVAPSSAAPSPRPSRELSQREREALELWGETALVDERSKAGGGSDRKAIHTALTLINVLGSFSSGVAGSRPVTSILKETRETLMEEYPGLARFKVLDSASVALQREVEDPGEEDGIVPGVSAWSRALMRELEDRLPGRFSSRAARMVVSSLGPELERHGFDLSGGEQGGNAS